MSVRLVTADPSQPQAYPRGCSPELLILTSQPSHCLVSRHPGRLSQDIMDGLASVEGLVVAGGVDGQGGGVRPPRSPARTSAPATNITTGLLR